VIVFTGFSIGIFKQARFLTKRLFMAYEDITETSTEDKS